MFISSQWTVKMFAIPWFLTRSNIPDMNFAMETTCAMHLTTRVRQLPYEVGTTECKLLDYVSSVMTGLVGKKYYRLIKNHTSRRSTRKMFFVNDAYEAMALGFAYGPSVTFKLSGGPLSRSKSVFANEVILSPFAHMTDYFLDTVDMQQAAMFQSLIQHHGSEIRTILTEYKETFSIPYTRGDALNCGCYISNTSLSWLFRGEDLFMPLSLGDALSFDVVQFLSSDVEDSFPRHNL